MLWTIPQGKGEKSNSRSEDKIDVLWGMATTCKQSQLSPLPRGLATGVRNESLRKAALPCQARRLWSLPTLLMPDGSASVGCIGP